MRKATLIIAFLILLVVAFQSVSALPQICNIQKSISCQDFGIGLNNITLNLLNIAGTDLTIIKISAASDALGGNSESANIGCGCTYSPSTPTQLRNGKTLTIKLDTPDAGCPNWCNERDNGKFFTQDRYNLTVFYALSDNPKIIHQLWGEIGGFPGWSHPKTGLQNVLWALMTLPFFYVLSAWLIDRKVKKNKSIWIWILTGLALVALYGIYRILNYIVPWGLSCGTPVGFQQTFAFMIMILSPFLLGIIITRVLKPKWLPPARMILIIIILLAILGGFSYLGVFSPSCL